MLATLLLNSTAMTGKDACWKSEKIASLVPPAPRLVAAASVVVSVAASVVVVVLAAAVGSVAVAASEVVGTVVPPVVVPTHQLLRPIPSQTMLPLEGIVARPSSYAM